MNVRRERGSWVEVGEREGTWREGEERRKEYGGKVRRERGCTVKAKREDDGVKVRREGGR